MCAVYALPVWLIITLLLNDLPFGRSRLVHTWPCLACLSVGGDGLWAYLLHRHCLLSETPALQSGLPGTPHMGLRGLACRSWSHPELSEKAPGMGQVLWDPGDPAGWSGGRCTLKSQPGRALSLRRAAEDGWQGRGGAFQGSSCKDAHGKHVIHFKVLSKTVDKTCYSLRGERTPTFPVVSLRNDILPGPLKPLSPSPVLLQSPAFSSTPHRVTSILNFLLVILLLFFAVRESVCVRSVGRHLGCLPGFCC